MMLHRPGPARLALFLALLAGGAAAAEDLRTLVGAVVVLPSDGQPAAASLAYNEALAIGLPKNAAFIQGIEIEVRSPQAALALPGSMGWEIWKGIVPAPEKTRFSYAGERLLMQALPARAGFVFQVPLRGDHSLRSGPYATVLPLVVRPEEFPFLFRLVPIGKGISSELEKASFQVKVRPLFTAEGGLRLSLKYPPGLADGEFSLLIDGREVARSELYVLEPGSHFLKLSSPVYRDESRSFAIEQGQVLELAIELADTTPVLLVEAPDSAVVLLDGVRINHVAKPQMTVEPGEHSLVCRIGDYSLTRKFTAFRGKTYKVVLSIDLVVQEQP